MEVVEEEEEKEGEEDEVHAKKQTTHRSVETPEEMPKQRSRGELKFDLSPMDISGEELEIGEGAIAC